MAVPEKRPRACLEAKQTAKDVLKDPIGGSNLVPRSYWVTVTVTEMVLLKEKIGI